MRLFRSSISRIAHQRVPDRGQVDADLVGPTGFQATFHQARVLQVREFGPMGYGALAAPFGNHRHLLAVLRTARKRCVDRSLAGKDGPGSTRKVAPVDTVRCELPRKSLVGTVGLRHHPQPRCQRNALRQATREAQACERTGSRAERNGVIAKVHFKAGESVEVDEVIMELE